LTGREIEEKLEFRVSYQRIMAVLNDEAATFGRVSENQPHRWKVRDSALAPAELPEVPPEEARSA
jgi:hypothetical protein